MKTKPNDTSAILSRGRLVLEVEARAIDDLIRRLDGAFEAAVELVYSSGGRVIASGLGKSGIICQKIAATLSSTGTASFFMHPAEAMHGDLGVIRGDDVVIALSYSGETDELLRLLERIRRLARSWSPSPAARRRRWHSRPTSRWIAASPKRRAR